MITDVTVTEFETVSKTFVDSDGHVHPGPARAATAALLAITDSDGAAGYCLAAPGFAVERSLIEHYVKPIIVGEDPFDREKLWQRMAREQRGAVGALLDRTLSTVEQALWDLAGRKLNLPVWKLLGGARDKVPVYASTMCGDDVRGGLSTPGEYGDFAVQLVEQGYRAIKLHTWMPPISFAPDVKMDVAACAAVREAVGPDVPLMLDANHWYSRVDALYLGKAIQDLGFTWYEEPMDEASMQSYKWLADQLEIPVIGPETAFGKFHVRAEWAVSGACDILRAGASTGGGIGPTMKSVHVAEAFGMDCEIHGGGSGNLAILGAMLNGRWYERGLLHPHYDFDEVPPHLNSIIDPVDRDGNVAMSSQPGLGDDYDFDYIDSHTVATW
ncbi:enolase C-terminal domain-like protein [Leifsonia sp. Root112D2]|uniref:enolase C-terminal domain-like protein n=1 Tax=Leifsonia sp. Root112D2 TaxID=1736426 RepID=UPI0006F983F5|nr:enolase C-terminal domain-like protein [Leifsonia sp. Root112D2]KQV06507.1 mandelate racemase [Leifsonia sp. Root112D2]